MQPLMALIAVATLATAPETTPANAVAVLGSPAAPNPTGFIVLPGEKEVAWVTGASLFNAPLNNPVPKLVVSYEDPNREAFAVKTKRDSLFLAPDGLSVYFMRHAISYERLRYPFDGEGAFEQLPKEVQLRNISAGISKLQITPSGQLIGISSDKLLHRYNVFEKNWIPANTTPPKSLQCFEIGGNIVAFGGRSTRTKSPPVEIVLHDLLANKDLKPINFESLYDMAMTRDGKTLAGLVLSSSEDKWHVQLWDIEKREVRKIRLDGPTDRLFLTKDGKRFARVDHAASSGLMPTRTPTIEFYETTTGKLISRSGIAGDYLKFGQFINDGKTFVAMSESGILRQWDVATGKPVPSKYPQGAILQVSCLSEGGYTALSSDGTYRRWDKDLTERANYEVIPQLKPKRDPFANFALSEDGKRLYAQGVDDFRRIVAWDLSTGAKIKEFSFALGQDNELTAMALSPDGKRLAVWGSAVRGAANHVPSFFNVNAATGKVEGTPSTEKGEARLQDRLHQRIALSDDGKVYSLGYKGFRAFDIKDGDCLYQSKADPPGLGICQMAVSPDGKTVAVTGAGQSPERLDHRLLEIALVDSSTGAVQRKISMSVDLWIQMSALAFSRDGKRLAVGFEKGNVMVFDLTQERPTAKEFLGHKQAVRCIDFAPDGKTFATGSDDTSVIVWKLDGK